MKKKLMNFVLIMMSLFFVGSLKVSAQTKLPIAVNDVASDTYIIGTHMFTENRTYLSTQDIMWASRTIDADSRDDMIIYYKDLNNKWINGITGEDITTPSLFNIEVIDGREASLININNVTDNDSGFALNTNLWGESFINITNDSDKNYTVNFNAYNMIDDTYKYELSCSNEENTLDLGIIPNEINILDGNFNLDIEVNKDATIGNYTCKMKVGKITSEFDINVGEPNPTLDVFALDITYGDEFGSGLIEIRPSNNIYYFQENNALNNDSSKRINISAHPTFMNEGEHSVEINLTRDGKDILISDQSTNINITYNDISNMYNTYFGFNINEKLTVGNYVINVKIDDTYEYEIYLNVTEQTKIELDKLVNNTDNIIYDKNTTILTSEKDKSFTAHFNTENIADGIYNVSIHNNAMGSDVDVDFNRSRTVEVKDNKFTFDFIMPKDSKTDNYFIALELFDDSNIFYGQTEFEFEITSNTETALKLVDNGNNDYIQSRDETTGDAKIKLLFSSTGKVDGYEVRVSDSEQGEYSLVKDVTEFDNNSQNLGNLDVTVPLLSTKYYVVVPYTIVNEEKEYGTESNIIKYTDQLDTPYFYSSNVTTNDDGSETLTLNDYVDVKSLISGYVVELLTDNGEVAEIVDDVTIDYNLVVDEYFTKQREITLELGETKEYRIRSYVMSNGEKVYSNSNSYIRSNSGIKFNFNMVDGILSVTKDEDGNATLTANLSINTLTGATGYEIIKINNSVYPSSKEIVYDNTIDLNDIENNSYSINNIELIIPNNEGHSYYVQPYKMNGEEKEYLTRSSNIDYRNI